MATRYVWSGAAGAGTGADWANAHTTFAAAITASTAGDLFLVDSTHSESNASAQTLTFKGTSAAPDTLISVLQATGVPTQGAAFITTGANNITIAGSGYFDGLNITCGSATNAAILTLAGGSGNVQRWRNSTITLSNNAASRLNLVTTTARAVFEKNVQLVGASANNWPRVSGGGHFVWRDSVPFAGTIPSHIAENGGNGHYLFEGCDLTAFASKTIRQSLATGVSYVTLVNCQLVSSIAIGTFLNRADYVRIINCANADGKNRTEYHDYSGAATIDRTIVRTGGASDGEDSISFKLVSTASASRYFPCQSQDIAFNVSSTGSKTVTVHVVTDNVTLTDAECWVEVDYLGTATSLDTSVIDDANVLQAAGVAQTTSTEAWTTTGLVTPVYQQLAVTFTTNKIGMHRLRVKLAKASTTVYACPKVVVS